MPIFISSVPFPPFDTRGVDSQLQRLSIATWARNARTCWKVSMSAMITHSCHVSWARCWAPCSSLVSHLLLWPCSRHPCPPRGRVHDFRSWKRRGCALESATDRVGRGAGRRMPTSLMDGGMDHGPYPDQDGRGLEVGVDDPSLRFLILALRQAQLSSCGYVVYRLPLPSVDRYAEQFVL